MSNYKILVIDYEPRGIQQLCVPLEMAGFTVELAKDGIRGVEMFDELKPDLTLIEAMIPKKHGFEVCEQLKKTPHGMLTPIVIVTSVYKGRRYRTQALHHYRCDEYLEKPIPPEKLIEVVNRLLQESRADRPAESSAPPAAEPAKAAAPSAAAGQQDAELEIMSRLDELLGDNGEASGDESKLDESTVTKDEVLAHVEESDQGIPQEKVLSFDPERTKRKVTPPVVDTPSAPTVKTRGSVAEQPHPRHEVEVPAPRPEVAPRKVTRPDPAPVIAPQVGGRIGWTLVGVALGIIATALLFYLVGPL